jgi:hypothetical protein
MTDTVQLARPLKIETDSVHRVAYDLMMTIADNELSTIKKDRQYWLKLYLQAHDAVHRQQLPAD